jgi:flagellar biosynthesis GTPase FlhF
LGTAARLQAVRKKPLVLKLLPRHGGEIRRLQMEAAAQGYDAAIMQKQEQLPACLDHLATYDAVLIDTPSLFGEHFSAAGDLQLFLSQNESFHRHLVVPLDLDFQDASEVWEAGRIWNADWIALSRLDRTRRGGKILDLIERLPLPLSLCSAGPWPETRPHIASADLLVDLIVGGEKGSAMAKAKA